MISGKSWLAWSAALVVLLVETEARSTIFGENNLNDFGKTLCAVNGDDSLGRDAPPVGQLRLLEGRVDYLIGTGTLVSPSPVDGEYRRDLVVTAAHVLYSTEAATDVRSVGGKVVFRIWERTLSGECVERDFGIAAEASGAAHPEAVWTIGTDSHCRHTSYYSTPEAVPAQGSCLNPDFDYAVLRLSEAVESLFPMELASSSLVGEALRGEVPVGAAGFAYHESTGFGSMLSSVSCYLRKPQRANRMAQNMHVAIHDCDVSGGMSGSAIAVTRANEQFDPTSGSEARKRRFLRYLVGVNIQEAILPYASSVFSPINHYNSALLLSESFREAFAAMESWP